jgi:restriction system protein
MAFKGKSSPAEDFIHIAAKLPYWAALVLAVISYFLLHAYATQPSSIVIVPGQMANAMIPAVLKGLATAGQYILPILFVAAAILAWFSRSKPTSLQKINPSSRLAPANGRSVNSVSCPLCSSEMVRREAKRGTNAGKSFWGCSKYPACKGTRVAD